MMMILMMIVLVQATTVLHHHPVLEMIGRRLQDETSVMSSMNLTSMGPCLAQYQYSMYRDMVSVPACFASLGSAGFGEPSSSEGTSPVEGGGGGGRGGVSLDLNTIMSLVETLPPDRLVRSFASPFCSVWTDTLLPCFYLMAPELTQLVNCMISDEASVQSEDDIMTLFDNITGALCRSNAEGQKCLVVLSDIFMPSLESAFESPSSPSSSFTILTPEEEDQTQAAATQAFNNCDTQLGCCGPPLQALGTSITKLNGTNEQDFELLGQLASASCTQTCEDTTFQLPARPDAEAKLDAAKYKLAGRSNGALLPTGLSTAHDLNPMIGPQGIHLSLPDGSGTGMTVMWMTFGDSETIVDYGINPEDLKWTKSGSSSSYNLLPEDLPDIPNPTTYHHRVSLTDLEPGMTYYYSCRSSSSSDMVNSPIHHFTTSSPSAAYQVAIVGDMGLYESTPTLNLLESLQSDLSLMFHIGDIAYADNDLIHNLVSFEYENIWNDYMVAIENFTAEVPYMVLPGNHEAECHSPLVCMTHPTLVKALGNFSAYNHRFHMPENGVENMWYSLTQGPVHFIVIDTETDFPNAPEPTYVGEPLKSFGDQVAWLEAELEKAQEAREERPFIIVLGHRPLYSRNPDQDAPLQAWLEPVFERYNVDLYFSGHIHHYERSSPVYLQEAETVENPSLIRNARHTQYIVHGAGGNEETVTGDSESGGQSRSSGPKWALKSDFAELGVGILTVYNKTTIKWEYHGASSNSIVDAVTIDVSNKKYNKPNAAIDSQGNHSAGSPIETMLSFCALTMGFILFAM